MATESTSSDSNSDEGVDKDWEGVQGLSEIFAENGENAIMIIRKQTQILVSCLRMLGQRHMCFVTQMEICHYPMRF